MAERITESRKIKKSTLPRSKRTEDKVLVFGSRGWKDRAMIRSRLKKMPMNVIVIHGGAPGADEIAGEEAYDQGKEVWQVNPDYTKFPRRIAPLKRNERMARLKPKLAIAYWDGKSRGTKHMIETCLKHKIPLEIYFG